MDKFTRARNLVLALAAGGLLAAWAMGDDLPWIYDLRAVRGGPDDLRDDGLGRSRLPLQDFGGVGGHAVHHPPVQDNRPDGPLGRGIR